MMENQLVKRVGVTLGVVLIAFVSVKTASEFKSMHYIGKSANAANVITVSGKGEVLATPDIATFSFGVTQEAANVGDAQAGATDKTNKILASIKAAGVEDKDIKTSSYNIYPRYDYLNAGPYNSGTQHLAAYVVSQNVEVKVRKLEDAGKIIAGIGSLGATDVSGLSFSVDKQDDLARDARNLAIKDAREQAAVLAHALGVDLGNITTFYESSPSQPYPIYYGKDMMAASARVEAAPTIPAGESKIVSNVTITYEIR